MTNATAANDDHEVAGRLLLSASSAAANLAKRWSSRRVFLHVAILAFAVCEIFHLAPSQVCSLGLFVAAGASIVALTQHKHSHNAYRRLRSNLLLTDSFGLTLSQLDNQELISFGSHGNNNSHLPLETYYSSQLPTGPDRLKSNLAETLFFSSNLYELSRKRLDRYLLLPISVVVLAAVAVPMWHVPERSFFTAEKVLILFVAFINEIHLLTERAELDVASSECKALLARLTSTEASDALSMDHIFARYAAIASASPAPFASEYNRYRKPLNEVWNARRATYEPK